jgi:hypothetical protein
MASRTYPPKSSTTTKAAPKRDDWTKTMLERARETFAFETEQRRRVVEDMKFAFVSGNQWDAHLTAKRKNRPCYESNRIRQLIRRVTGQQLKNKPQIKVRAVEDNDVDTAEVYNGLIKNIEVQSSAENAYDVSMQWACGGGYGVIRVVSEYEGHDTFDQCLKIKTVMDPMRCWCDPAAVEFDRSDARWWFIDEFIPTEEFKRRWPKAEVVNFDGPADDLERDWVQKDDVRIAEYWYKERETKTIHLLTDGSVVDDEDFALIEDEAAAGFPDPQTGQATQEPVTIKQTREVEVDCVYSARVSGKGKLEEPTKWGGSMIPIVPQWGDLVMIEGKQIYSGMTRFGKDMQMIHNFEISTAVEVIAKLPNSPLMATPAQVKGLESYYERMGYDDPPVMLYNRDAGPNGEAPPPMRQPMANFPGAMVQMSQVATDELKASLGVYDASLGNRSNESSGRAILARQNEGEVANFVYVDNQVKALKRLGEILVDSIPHYYDAERSIRILGEDNAEKYIQINKVTIDQQTGEQVTINDLSRGKYDVTVTVGKSFDTARMELAEAAQALSQQPGPFGALGQFMLLKSIDVPGMDEYVKAARKVLVSQGLLDPGDGEQPPAPPPPNPKDVASAEKDKASAQKYAAEAQGQELENMDRATQMGVQAGMMGMPPPPIPNGQLSPSEPQPPQGGFSLGGTEPPQ